MASNAPPAENAQPPLWRDLYFWLTLAFTVFAAAPFWLPGYFWGANDARHHVYFLFEYDRLVQDGIWWPRWSPDFAFGYGYPFFNIYGLFSHFLAELLHHFLNFSYTAAVESIFVVSIVGAAGAMYAFVRSWGGRAAGMVAALVYTYAPYHLLNLYVRANLAESMAFVWLPLVLWTARQSVVRPRVRWVIGLAVSYAGLMLTSNLVIVLFTPLLVGYVLVLTVINTARVGAASGGGRGATLRAWIRRCIPPFLGGLAGLGLSAVFWLPMLLERQYVRVDQWFGGRYDFRGHFVYLHQLFSPTWGFGVSVPGPDDPISFQLGAAAVVLATLGVIFTWRTLGKLRWEIGYFLLAGAVGVFVTLQIVAPLWEVPIVGGLLQSAQFPWRWLVLPTLCISVVAGLVGMLVAEADQRKLTLPLLGLVAVVILSSYPYLRVEISEPVEGPVGLAGLMQFQQSSDEMTGSTAWVKEIPSWSPMADYYLSQYQAGGAVKPVDTKLDYAVFDYDTFGASSVAHDTVSEEVYFSNTSGEPRNLVFNHFYYPGWNAYLLDGEHGRRVQQLAIAPEESGTLGRMTVAAPPGEGYILLVYEDTPPRTVGGIITLATLAALTIAAVVAFARSRRSK